MSLFRFASPQTFYPLAGRLIPWFSGAALLLAAVGLWIGFVVAPTEAIKILLGERGADALLSLTVDDV